MLALLALVMLTIALVLVLLATNTGLDLARRIAVSLVPALRVGEIKGSIYSSLEITDVGFEHEVVSIRAEHVSVRYRFSALLTKTLEVEYARISGADVTVRIPQPEDEPPPSEPFSFPIRIRAHDVAVAASRVDVSDRGEAIVHGSRINLIANGEIHDTTIDVEAESFHAYASTFGRGGEITLSGAWLMQLDGFMEGHAQLDVERQGYPPVSIDASMRRPIEASDVSVTVRSGESTLKADGVISMADFTWPLIAARVSLDRVDPHAFEALAPSLPITGTVIAAMRGPIFDPEGEASAQVALRSPTYAGYVLDHARVEASLHGLDVSLDELDAKAFDTEVTAKGHARLDPENDFIPREALLRLRAASSGRVELPVPDHLMRVRADVDADVRWHDGWLEGAEVAVRAPSFRFDDVVVSAIDVRARSNGRAASAELTAFPEGGSKVHVAASAGIGPRGLDPKRPPSIRVETVRFPLRYVSRFAKGVSLPDGKIDLQARADDTVRATVTYFMGQTQRFAASVEAAAPLMDVIARPLQTPLRVDVRVDEAPLQALLGEWGVPPPPLQAVVAVSATLAGTILQPKASAEVRVLKTKLSPQGLAHDLMLTLELEAASTTRLNGRIRSDDKRIFTLDASVAMGMRELMKGSVLTGRRLSVEAKLVPTELQRLASFFGSFNDMSGYAEGFVRASGTTDRPLLDADIRVVEATYNGIGLGTLTLTAKTTSGEDEPVASISCDLQAPRFAGGHISGSGKIDLTGQKPIRASAKLEDVQISPFAKFIPRVRRLAGVLDAEASIEGTLAKPLINGRVVLQEGYVDAWRLPPLRFVSIEAGIDKHGAKLTKLFAMFPDRGTIEATGSIGLTGFTPGAVIAHAEAKRIPLPIRGLDDIRVTGTVDVKMPELVKGEVHLSHARVDVPTLAVPKTLSETEPLEGVVFIGDTAAPEEDAAEPLELPLDLKVLVDDTLIRGKDIDVTIGSKLYVTNAQDGGVALGGSVESRRGRVNIFNRGWDIRRVALEFNGTSDVNPGLDIALTRQFSEAFVTLRVQGTIRAPELVLSSQPALDRSQIISLIISGTTGGKAADTGGAIAAAAISGLLGGITSSLVSKVGLDVLRVDMNNAKARVELGKYIGDRFYVGYRRLLGSGNAGDLSNSNELRVEYRLTPRLILESAFGDAGTGGLDLMWTYRY